MTALLSFIFPYKHEWFLLLAFLFLGILWAWSAWGYFAQRFSAAGSRQGKLQDDIRGLRRKKVALTGEGELEPIFTGRASSASDLTKIKGVSDDDAVELNRLGVYNYGQAANIPDSDVEILGMQKRWKKHDFNAIRAEAKGLVATEEAANDTVSNLQPAKSSAGSTAGNLAAFKGEDVTQNPRYGTVYSARPANADDLQDIDGIGPSTEKSLNQVGVYRFNQIAGWNDGIITGVSDDLSLGARVRDESWVAQARQLAEGGSSSSSAVAASSGAARPKPSKPSPKPVRSGSKPVAKPRVVAKPKAKSTTKPKTVSKSTSRTTKATKPRATKTTTTKTKAKTTTKAKAKSSTRSADEKLAKSQFKGENVKVDDVLGIVYKSRPKAIDDLKEIKGVAGVMEKKLHKFGVYRFKQIASWKKAHVDAFAEQLGSFKSRMLTDDWIGQAKKLAKKSS